MPDSLSLMYKLLTPPVWKEYELIDAGQFEKLERFGKYILYRPEPQAVWDKKLSEQEWDKLWTAKYTRTKGIGDSSTGHERGRWEMRPGMPEHWFIQYEYEAMVLSIRLALTAFGHIGIFPEQAINWSYIYDFLMAKKTPECHILNLFAYTGVASLVSKYAGADIVHVDSVKQTVNWSNVNMQASHLKDIRWVVEDVLKFIRREVIRGHKYHGIIMDPPSYGRGPIGEKWVFEEGINELVTLSGQLLYEMNSFFILNFYSMGLSALVIENLIKEKFAFPNPELGEFYISSKTGCKLPLGTFLRFAR
ncbi:MAG: class I SAM-dependent methyltransferase [Bacteroidetes bacterium]|nr:class I SAM-dependent methyltransferase [Bacteroidota bacterium]